jgi:hypothetical protein
MIGSAAIAADSSLVLDTDVVTEWTGETRTGELRCCSCSYSLIKRFFNGCALFDDTDVVGEFAEDTGDAINGGVTPLELIGGLRRLDDES